ncbi:MAG: vitamin B12-dependent ribonucleotide reductase, partial [Desulfacinum sp.]|nr:vitamin B12-dependent ribonucleotide reductase [Desulfacinum sp.]
MMMDEGGVPTASTDSTPTGDSLAGGQTARTTMGKTKSSRKRTLRKVRLTPNALLVMRKRYLKKDHKGEPAETPEELFWRVAQAIAEADANYGATDEEVEETAVRFYNLMTSLDFMPNSPTLMNAGTELGQLSACFVLPVGDSLEEIFEAVKHAAKIHQSG